MPPARAVAEPTPTDEDLAFESYWESLSQDQQSAMESDAVRQADAFLFRQYHAAGQGSLFEAVRHRILRNHWMRQRATVDGAAPAGRPAQSEGSRIVVTLRSASVMIQKMFLSWVW